ncbi:MAG: T9SS type A sorting domain-containing protein [Bacteroidia bacterium]
MKKLLLTGLICVGTYAGYSQMVGPDTYVKGTYMEFAVTGLGGFEGVDITASPVPAGMHWRSGNQIFGIMGNPQKNGWSGSAFDGDFFSPGSPENGWGFEIGTSGSSAAGTQGGNNCAYLQEINGVITSYTHAGGYFNIGWQGTNAAGSLTFNINYKMQDTALFYTTTVAVTNNTAFTIPDFYYYKNIDPDNNQSISGSFTTTNTIDSQPSGGAGYAMVHATQPTPWTSYIALIGNGADWRATYGGFSNRDASDLWNLGNTIDTAGSTNNADEAISLSYRIQNFPAGSTQSFSFNTVIDTSSVNAAIDNVLFIDFAGEDNNSSLIPDTTAVCNVDSIALTVTGLSVADYNWSWSPSTGLSDSTGISVMASPAIQTTYTVIGTPVASGGTADTMLIVVNPPVSYSGPAATLSFLGNHCGNDPPISLSSGMPSGGMYSGTGVSGNNFYPSMSGAGDFMITYTVSDSSGCNAADTALIHVFHTNISIPSTYGNICNNDFPLVLTGATVPGGIFSGGPYIVSDSIFDPSAISSAGSYPIYYTATDSNGCAGSDTSSINVFICTSGAGIGTNQMNDEISVYPNPFSDNAVFFIGNNLQLVNAELLFYDITGKEIRRIKVSDHHTIILHGDLANGMYFLRLNNNGNTIATGKLFVN